MKLYVIYTNYDYEIIGITEEKAKVYLFIEQRKLKSKDISFTYLTNEKEINKHITKYEDLILEEQCKTIFTRKDAKLVRDMIQEHEDKIIEVTKLMKFILKNYNLTKKEHKVINSSYATLFKITKTNRLYVRAKIRNLILESFFSKDSTKIRQELDEMIQINEQNRIKYFVD
jgi:hypothetical protein